MRARRSASAKRVRRIKGLSHVRARAGPVVAKLGGIPSMIHGADVTGMTNTLLTQARRIVHAASRVGNNVKCLTTSLLTSTVPQLDPSFRATAEPLLRWARTVATGRFSPAALGPVFRSALGRLGRRPQKMWQLVRSPIDAVIATAARIGWRFASGTGVRDRQGVIHDLLTTSTRVLRRAIDRDVEGWLWAGLASHHAAKRGVAPWVGGWRSDGPWELVRQGVFLRPLLRLIPGRGSTPP